MTFENCKEKKTRTVARKRTQRQSATGSNDVDVYRAAKEQKTLEDAAYDAKKGGLAYLLLVTIDDGSRETC